MLTLDEAIAQVAGDSEIARRIDTLPGFGATCSAELAGEIGTLQRFASEAGLALYLGMAILDHSSGNQSGSRRASQINTRAKAAMMTAAARQVEQVFTCLYCRHASKFLPNNAQRSNMPVREIDKVFKALADPSRRELLDRLHVKNGQTLSELCAGLDMTRQAVTQHLDLLEEANLVSV